MDDSKRKVILPDFPGSCFEGYAVNYCNTNYWKFAKTIGSLEDAVSEAKVCYYDCRRLYGDKVENQKHFMALYKRCMWSWFADWATYDYKVNKVEKEYMLTFDETTFSDGDLAVKLREASQELKQVLNLILNGPSEIVSVLKKEEKFFERAADYCGLEKDQVEVLQQELLSITG